MTKLSFNMNLLNPDPEKGRACVDFISFVQDCSAPPSYDCSCSTATAPAFLLLLCLILFILFIILLTYLSSCHPLIPFLILLNSLPYRLMSLISPLFVLFQVFYLNEPVDASMDTKLHGTIAMVRQEKNKRLYNLKLDSKVDDSPSIQGIYEIP